MLDSSVIQNISKASSDKKHSALEKIRKSNTVCQACNIKGDYSNYNAVPGYGNDNAEIMLIGEAPGKDEAEQGIPFVGQAGKMLNWAIAEAGLDREELYLHNILSCRPLKNKFPEGHEGILVCRKWLQLEVSIIKPKVIVAIGKMAYESLLNLRRTKITKERGTWQIWEMDDLGHKVWFAPTLHPSYCMRQRNMGDETAAKQLVEDLSNAKIMVDTDI